MLAVFFLQFNVYSATVYRGSVTFLPGLLFSVGAPTDHGVGYSHHGTCPPCAQGLDLTGTCVE